MQFPTRVQRSESIDYFEMSGEPAGKNGCRRRVDGLASLTLCITLISMLRCHYSVVT